MPQQSTGKTASGMAPGRRHRPNPTTNSAPPPTNPTTAITATCHQNKTLTDAKAKFVASVSHGISVLMEEHGYSRDRAQTALLREIARGDANPPTDMEIFQAMSSHGLGIEGAAQALTVSKALEREQTERNVTLLEAIDDLTSKLSVANLIRIDRGTPSPVLPTSPSRQSEVRIQPVPPVTLPRLKTTTTTTCITSAPTPSATSSSGRKAKFGSKTAKQKHGNGNSRKRSVEDITAVNKGEKHVPTVNKEEEPSNDNNNNHNTKKSFTRERSDSLSEVVSAKFGDNADEASRSTSPPAAAVVRAKRSRIDDGDTSQNPVKRARADTQI